MNSIELNDRKINYSLKRSRRKSLGIAVDTSGQLIITAPEFVPLDKIEEILHKRRDWIIEKITKKESNLQIQPPRKFVSGESVYLFGRQFYLKIIKTNDYHIEKNGNRLTFYVKDYSESEKIVKRFLEDEFRKLVTEKTALCLDNFKKKHNLFNDPDFKIRKMVRRWGSCTSDGVISLNPKLVAASVECIEYVIYHEITHLLHDDHSEDFYGTLRSICPEYKKIKEKLDRETVLFEDW